MIRLLAIGLVLALVLLRVVRSRWGSRLIGVSERALDVVYLVALLATGVIAVATEYWWLLAVVGILLGLRLLEAIRSGAGAASRPHTRPAPRARQRRR